MFLVIRRLEEIQNRPMKKLQNIVMFNFSKVEFFGEGWFWNLRVVLKQLFLAAFKSLKVSKKAEKVPNSTKKSKNAQNSSVDHGCIHRSGDSHIFRICLPTWCKFTLQSTDVCSIEPHISDTISHPILSL